MRRPHVFERTAPRRAGSPYAEPDHGPAMARMIGAQIGTMIDKARQAGLVDLARLLDGARVEAERNASE